LTLLEIDELCFHIKWLAVLFELYSVDLIMVMSYFLYDIIQVIFLQNILYL